MFGSFRTWLAVMVVAFHLLGVPLIGPYAVFSFFVLSGFLMTTIMHGSYGYTLAGRRRFAINRILRLYPAYWIAALVAIAVILGLGEDNMRRFRDTIYLPRSLPEILSNLTMIYPDFFPASVQPRLSPPTWAITVELVYYALICVGISRTRMVSLAWLAASLIYVAVTLILREPHAYRYASIPAGSLPFAIGSCVYFYKQEIRTVLDWAKVFRIQNIVVALLATYALSVVGFHRTKSDALQETGLYLSTALAAALMVRLYDLQASPQLARLDKLIGDYSYPIYLLHWQLGALAAFLLKGIGGRAYGPAAVFILAMIMVLAVATAIVFGLDPAIERLRRTVRRQASRREAPDALPARV
jgi:peptidoglycan/LPS O-acetylase OafA/YrhL